MIFDGLKPWLPNKPITTVEVIDSGEVFDIHSEWSLRHVTIENIGTHSNMIMHFSREPSLSYKNKNGSNEFELAFVHVDELAIQPEFGAEGGPYDNVDEFRYWERRGMGFIEFFGAMRRIQFTFEKVTLKLESGK